MFFFSFSFICHQSVQTYGVRIGCLCVGSRQTFWQTGGTLGAVGEIAGFDLPAGKMWPYPRRTVAAHSPTVLGFPERDILIYFKTS